MANYKKPDHWQLKARSEGYPARSVYKLKEINEKFGLIRPRSQGGLRVLDLGSAPGSWSLFVLREFSGVYLVSSDISPLSEDYGQGFFCKENFYFIQGDITEPVTRDAIIARGPYNAILSDAAPATTGNRFIDTARSLELAEAVASYAETALSKGGSLAVKVFQGGDTAALLKRLAKNFASAKSYKPQACRSDSFETYYLGINKK
jgi:23S rRNA (uridine2552-2'-O)-methyltransferase